MSRLVEMTELVVDEVWKALGDAELHDLETALLVDASPETAGADILKRPEKPKFAKLGHWRVGLLSLLAH